MNIEKRRKTRVVGREFVHKNAMKPLLERMTLLKPEYQPHADRHLFELTMKKRSDTDKIPVTIALFVYQLSKLHFFKFVLMMKEHFEEDAFKICYIGISSIRFIQNK